MYLTGHKKIITAFLLIAFIGQSITALAMSCQLETHRSSSHTMMNMDHSMMNMDHSLMNHATMNHTTMNHTTMNHSTASQPTKKTNCCKTLGHCLSGNCSLLGVNSNHLLIAFTQARSNVAHFYTATLPLPFISSLYRPPIFC